MAKAEIEQQSSHRRQNRFLLLLLMGAALMSAAKDIVRLHDFTSGLVGLATSLHQTVNAAVASPADTSCPQALAENDNSAQPYLWNGRVAPDQLIEMNDSHGGIDAEPAVGSELDVAINCATEERHQGCSGQATNSEPAAAIPVAARSAEVASTALQTGEHSRRPHSADRGRNRSAIQSVAIGLRNHNNQLNFIVRVPSAIALVSRKMNAELSATWLTSDPLSSEVFPLMISRVDGHSVNHRLSISTGCRAPTILSREINAKLADANRSNAIEFKTARRIISLDLLQILKANIEAENLNGDTVPDVRRTLKVVIQDAMSAAPAVVEDAH